MGVPNWMSKKILLSSLELPVSVLGDRRYTAVQPRTFSNTFVIDVKLSGPRDHGFMSVCSLLPSQAACQTGRESR